MVEHLRGSSSAVVRFLNSGRDHYLTGSRESGLSRTVLGLIALACTLTGVVLMRMAWNDTMTGAVLASAAVAWVLSGMFWALTAGVARI